MANIRSELKLYTLMKYLKNNKMEIVIPFRLYHCTPTIAEYRPDKPYTSYINGTDYFFTYTYSDFNHYQRLGVLDFYHMKYNLFMVRERK